MGLQSKLTLGNLNAKRDWGFAGDYVDGMYKILDYSESDNYVYKISFNNSIDSYFNWSCN